MRVKVSHTGLYTYPDVVVVCGEIRFEDVDNDTLLNPTVICGSPFRLDRSYDRGEKFAPLSAARVAAEYLLIAQDKSGSSIMCGKAPSGYSRGRTLEETVHLAAVDCDVALRDVYDKVVFAGSDEATSSDTDMEAGR